MIDHDNQHMSPATPDRPGLRERKKVRSREVIQDAALRLFAEQGYAATTVQQIADAADVSERTFFRYFPGKAYTVLRDALDPDLAAAFVAQPADLSPTAALRAAVRAVYRDQPDEHPELAELRQRLLVEVQELREISAARIQAGMELFARAAAERTGRRPHDPEVRAWVGAIGGLALSSYLAWAADPRTDLVEYFDTDLSLLEAGLPL
jgi:AcrR family transcriptional regulator